MMSIQWNRIGISILTIAILGLVGGLIFRQPLAPDIAIDLANFHLDRATTDAEREVGLGGRAAMGDDEGMLFIFDKPGIYSFWMKGMQFSLDLIWLNGDRVVDVVTLPPPASGDAIPATHAPIHLADKVLEINAGLAKKRGIEVGARLLLPQD